MVSQCVEWAPHLHLLPLPLALALHYSHPATAPHRTVQNCCLNSRCDASSVSMRARVAFSEGNSVDVAADLRTRRMSVSAGV